uniref:Transmembrane protein n=1 Tax=Sipha flava TaxID=143950 RepID=A0A2S2QVU7_9HEMI
MFLVTVGLWTAVNFVAVAGLIDAITFAVGFCIVCGLLKLLVRLGSSVFLTTTGLMDDLSEFVFLRVDATGPLLLIVSLLPLLSALVTAFVVDFSVSKLPDEVS